MRQQLGASMLQRWQPTHPTLTKRTPHTTWSLERSMHKTSVNPALYNKIQCYLPPMR